MQRQARHHTQISDAIMLDFAIYMIFTALHFDAERAMLFDAD